MHKGIYKKDNLILRCLDVNGSECLVIDCVKKTMPSWVDQNLLNDYEEISEESLLKELNVTLPSINQLSQPQLKIMHLRFGSISSCLAKVINNSERKLLIHKASLDYEVSVQTIRHRLCDYLVFQNITVLAPTPKKVKTLSEDEKNFRWALNKYFYNSKKLSLRQAYKFLIRDKYVDSEGKIPQKCPKFHQFKYFYYKNRSESNYIISRLGRGEYDRNYRPLLGDSVRSFCPSIGYGMLDSTVCDIYLVNDDGELIGRPILTACIDAYSTMCLGYSLSWEGGINSLKRLMLNVITDKVDWCKRFGIEINESDWRCRWIPHKLITDKGSEYVGDTFSQLVDLGIELINLEPYRPELKSLVERFFGLIQEYFKKELINKGVVLKDFGDRGAIDYRKNACLTLEQFEKILIFCIIHYNCSRVIELPPDVGLKEHARDLWNNCLLTQLDTLISVDSGLLELTLLPRCKARFKRDGLCVNRLRYSAYGCTDQFLKGGDVVVAYDPNNVSHVWLINDGEYKKFNLIESAFAGMSVGQIETIKTKNVSDEAKREELEGEINLSKQIDLIAQSIISHPKINGVRKTRKKERDKRQRYE